MKAQRVDPAAPVVYSVVRSTTAQTMPIVVSFVRDPDVTACEALTAADKALTQNGAQLALVPQKQVCP